MGRPMNIWALKGFKVRVWRLTVGINHIRADERGVLELGKVYTVHHTDVAAWSSSVYLQEFPGRPFNTVMFEDVEGQKNEDHLHPQYHKYE